MQLLTQRLPRDQRLQLPDQLGVPPEGQIGLNPGLHDGEPLLLEPGALGLRERLVGELRQRWAAPQPQRLAELGRGESRRWAERLSALVGEPLKAGQVELVGVEFQQVAGPAADQDESGWASGVRVQQLAQARDVDLHGVGGAVGRRLTP